jgi:5'-nucleotidase (lipoprotein e(P4) family)
MNRVFPILLAAYGCLLVSCSTPQGGGRSSRALHPGLLATAYVQASAECRALSLQAYGVARANLPSALSDSGWSAIPGQGGDKPPAIIFDIDETLLDNTPWQVRAIRGGYDYPTGWKEWCLEAQADALPGALEFVKHAASMGIEIFYVSNRKAPVEEATRVNLKALGFPLSVERDTVLLRNEKVEWTSDKTSRREMVARDFRVLMMFGDNLGDFLETEPSQANVSVRAKAVDEHAEYWGSRWHMLPNPMYGGWPWSILGVQSGLSGDARHEALLQKLDSGSGK